MRRKFHEFVERERLEGMPDLMPALALGRYFGTSDRLIDILDTVLANESLAAELAARSYRHALDFDKYILFSEPPFAQLRLHVWFAEDARRQEHVHNHRFGFASVIVHGRIRAYLYSPDADGSPHQHYRESAERQEQRWKFEDLGATRLATSMVVEIPAGGYHMVAPATMHHIEVPANEAAVTLFVETSSVRASSSVFVPQGGESLEGRRQVVYARSEVQARLGQLRGLLAAEG